MAVLEAFRPQLIVVPCGYDAGRFDPLGRMLLDGVTFRWMTLAMMPSRRMIAPAAVGRAHRRHALPYSRIPPVSRHWM